MAEAQIPKFFESWIPPIFGLWIEFRGDLALLTSLRRAPPQRKNRPTCFKGHQPLTTPTSTRSAPAWPSQFSPFSRLRLRPRRMAEPYFHLTGGFGLLALAKPVNMQPLNMNPDNKLKKQETPRTRESQLPAAGTPAFSLRWKAEAEAMRKQLVGMQLHLKFQRLTAREPLINTTFSEKSNSTFSAKPRFPAISLPPQNMNRTIQQQEGRHNTMPRTAKFSSMRDLPLIEVQGLPHLLSGWPEKTKSKLYIYH